MRYLWLFYFPLLFLPNLGFSRATEFGTIEFADFLMGPYLLLVALGVNWGDRLNIGRLTPWMGIFVAWALLSTVTIALRYGYPDNQAVEFGLLKIAKMGLYGVAGILTARALHREDARRAFDWSLLAGAMVAGVSMWSTRIGPAEVLIATANRESLVKDGIGYSANNGISVMTAILVIYLGSRWVTGHGSPLWRIVAPIGLVITVGGMAVSTGRGGWLAAIAGAIYLLFRIRVNWRLLALGTVAIVVVTSLYQTQPVFREQVDVTIFLPPEQYGYQGIRTVGHIDDGFRLGTWANEAPKLDGAPILGTGMYHRGGPTGLWSTGSHNFWLQMFLEFGIVGGALLLALLVLMWRQATQLCSPAEPRVDVALKAAIVTAFVGGLSGEYFYGGIILFTVLAVYAQIGRLPVVETKWSVAGAVSQAGPNVRAARRVALPARALPGGAGE